MGWSVGELGGCLEQPRVQSAVRLTGGQPLLAELGHPRHANLLIREDAAVIRADGASRELRYGACRLGWKGETHICVRHRDCGYLGHPNGWLYGW